MSLIAASALAGCGAPAFPKDLFTVSASEADYPVMLSDTKGAKSENARTITVESGMRAAQSQSTYYVGNNTNVTVTHVTEEQSELPASEKLAAKVKRSDRWVQLQRTVFTATDFDTYGASSIERILIIDATAHR